MKRLIPVLIAVLYLGLPSFAAAQTSCAELTQRYEQLSKILASNYAEGITDNSAPRAAVRAAEDNTTMLEAQLIVDLMQARNCPLPDAPPSRLPYLSSAMKCEADLIGARSGDLPESCKIDTWTASDYSSGS